ncbi:hypothetical protein RJ640_020467 [Escallonia rubra]|uniref:Protein At-4/1 n=1 Tax=Escallonia rubra TaxID=112253 RepID=A0AA88RYX9_9ASTE|nr:hypothetical protein RJ640_020467 [Escallonia rubra]
MAATSDEGLESLLCSFDHIYDDSTAGVARIQSLQSSCNAEIKKREALEFTVSSLRSENERLAKRYTESLNKMAYQIKCRTSCQSLKEELKRVNDEYASKESEHMNAMESLKQDHAAKVTDLESQIRDFLIQKAAAEAIIKQLHQDLAAHRNHIEALASRLQRVHSDVDSRYHYEIQDLKDCLMIEQEEKNELNKKLQNLEKELLIGKTKLVEHQQDLTSNRHVESLKQKVMKLRKENEVLRRQLLVTKEG